MNDQFKTLIYSNREEEIRNINMCMKEAAEMNKCSITDIQNDIRNNIATPEHWTFVEILLRTEGRALFQKVCDCFATEFWRRHSCPSNKCAKKCPFGDICRKDYVIIDDKKYCYGNLITKQNIKRASDLETRALTHSVSIHRKDGSTIFDLNGTYDEQLLESWFGKYEWHIQWFGDDGGSGNKKVFGLNAIQFLITNKDEH